MNQTLPQLLTKQFYDWEQRGRGQLLFTTPVQLECVFYPFFFHFPPPVPYIDDGKRLTILHKIANLFKGNQNEQAIQSDEIEDEALETYTFDSSEPLVCFSLILPKGHKIDITETEQLLLMLSYCTSPVSFEIVGSQSAISIQLACRQSDANHIASQLKAFFPDCIVKEKEDALFDILEHDKYACLVDFGLQREFMAPITMTDNFNLDPFKGIFASLEYLQAREHIVIQILFSGAVNPWTESIMRSVMDNKGGAFFENSPELVKLAQKKVSVPLFAATIRVMSTADTLEQSIAHTQQVGNALVRIYNSGSNTLIPLLDTDYDFDTRFSDLVYRESHRLGMLLNSRELATLVHLPSDSVTSSKLERTTRKTKEAPAITNGHEFVLGINEHLGKVKQVTVSSEQRLKHSHVIGATGTGKSTFLLNLITQDIKNGTGIAVLDPHGDLIDSIISYIPESRLNDVVIIDPADSEYPLGFNFLTAHSEIEKDILSSDLVAVFKRLSTAWGDQMNSVFANAILAFLESREGGTLADLRRFLIEKDFRNQFLTTITDPNVIYYWTKEFPILKTNSIGPILTRLDTFLRPKLIRNMVSQKKGLDFGAMLDSSKIILVKLSQGLIGNENSYLLGTIIVSKIQQAAMARQAKAKEARNDFFLYIDEFQNFITPSMSSILSGARKYHLGLILAHQDMQQLIKQDSELASSVIGNAGTRICFRIGDMDAKRFADGFSYFEPEDLSNLNTGEAIGRIERSDYDFSLSTEPLPEAIQSEDLRNRIINYSREKYGTPVKEIETLLLQGQREIIVGPILPKPEIKKEEKPIIKVEPIVSAVQDGSEVENLKRQKDNTQHRYLQSLIKKMAESRGFKASIEEPTPDGKGRVDVSLERNGKKIAVEVCMTTETEWEVHNIEKCFNAGYEIVVECSNDVKALERVRKKVEKTIDKTILSRVLILEPEALSHYLDEEIAKENTTETRIKGYRVKVSYDTQTLDSMNQKKESVARLIVDSMKKLKK